MAAGDVGVLVQRTKGMRAAKLDGVNDYLHFSNPGCLQLISYASICLEILLRDLVATQTVMTKKDGWDHADGFYIEYQTGGAGLGKILITGSSGTNGFSDLINVAKDEWFHLCVIFNASVATVYVNGVSKGNVNIASIVPSAEDYVLGSFNKVAGFLNAYVRKLQIFSHVLTASEISASVSGMNLAGAVGSWPLSSDSTDISGNGNDGTDAGVFYTNIETAISETVRSARVTANDKYAFVPLSNGHEIMSIHIEEL